MTSILWDSDRWLFQAKELISEDMVQILLLLFFIFLHEKCSFCNTRMGLSAGGAECWLFHWNGKPEWSSPGNNYPIPVMNLVKAASCEDDCFPAVFHCNSQPCSHLSGVAYPQSFHRIPLNLPGFIKFLSPLSLSLKNFRNGSVFPLAMTCTKSRRWTIFFLLQASATFPMFSWAERVLAMCLMVLAQGLCKIQVPWIESPLFLLYHLCFWNSGWHMGRQDQALIEWHSSVTTTYYCSKSETIINIKTGGFLLQVHEV